MENNSKKILFLGGAVIERLNVGLADMIEAMEIGFRDKSAGLVELPLKPTIHPRPECFIRALPGYLKSRDVAGLKWVGAYPINRNKDLSLVSGLVILNDPQTGYPLAIMDAGWITAWRTAAVSAVAAKHLAINDATTLAICGAGVQGGTHLESLALVLQNLRQVKIFDPHPGSLNAFLERHSSRQPQLSLKAVSSPQCALQDAQVVVTAAPMMTEPLSIIQAEDLAPGILCLPVDLDSYFAPSAFAACQKIYSDDIQQLHSLQGEGRFTHLEKMDGDYGQLLTRQITGREHRDQRIMAISVGIALGDLIVADLIYRKALRQEAGAWLEL